MLDMGFIPDIKRIMSLLPPRAKRQNLLFSATFSNEIKKLADELLNAPQLIEVARRNTAAETVTQTAYKVPQDAKRALLAHIVRERNVWQVLCFVRTKHGASRLARQLEKDGLATSAIHGDKTQAARLEALSAFKDGKLQVLVATDVAARGLDIDDLPLVVNYELPHVPEDYIHRIGRTGRAGAIGEAMSFVAPEEDKYLVEIEKLLKKKVPLATADGFDASAVRHERASHAERTPRSPRSPRSPRTPRGHDAIQESRPARAQTASAERRPTADERRAEREAAYARNPDQPPLKRQERDGATPSPQGHGGAARGYRGSGPTPALLMKRPAREPEKV
jgi:ATP-dependent RNA helicase RhlE